MDNFENNKTTIELLSEFAEKSRRKIFSTEIPYYTGTVVYPVINHKRTFYIPNNSDEQSFLVGYNDPKSFGENELYFGVFFPLEIPNTKIIKIRRKDILDKLNPFMYKKNFKTNSNSFNSLTVINGNDISLVDMFFNNNITQRLVLESLNNIDDLNLNIGINEFNLDFIPSFKDKSNFGIFTKQKWIVDYNLIEALFKKIERFRVLISEH